MSDDIPLWLNIHYSISTAHGTENAKIKLTKRSIEISKIWRGKKTRPLIANDRLRMDT
jgi:hypothetical protein